MVLDHSISLLKANVAYHAQLVNPATALCDCIANLNFSGLMVETLLGEPLERRGAVHQLPSPQATHDLLVLDGSLQCSDETEGGTNFVLPQAWQHLLRGPYVEHIDLKSRYEDVEAYIHLIMHCGSSLESPFELRADSLENLQWLPATCALAQAWQERLPLHVLHDSARGAHVVCPCPTLPSPTVQLQSSSEAATSCSVHALCLASQPRARVAAVPETMLHMAGALMGTASFDADDATAQGSSRLIPLKQSLIESLSTSTTLKSRTETEPKISPDKLPVPVVPPGPDARAASNQEGQSIQASAAQCSAIIGLREPSACVRPLPESLCSNTTAFRVGICGAGDAWQVSEDVRASVTLRSIEQENRIQVSIETSIPGSQQSAGMSSKQRQSSRADFARTRCTPHNQHVEPSSSSVSSLITTAMQECFNCSASS
jgi:hypothetical protein